MANSNLANAKSAKNDEFYTQYHDIEKEINAYIEYFDEATRKSVYSIQTAVAVAKVESNCPLCALGHDANKGKIWKLAEMDTDHVAAWSKGGATEAQNCKMLCKTHNRAKGNRQKIGTIKFNYCPVKMKVY